MALELELSGPYAQESVHTLNPIIINIIFLFLSSLYWSAGLFSHSLVVVVVVVVVCLVTYGLTEREPLSFSLSLSFHSRITNHLKTVKACGLVNSHRHTIYFSR